MITQYDVEHLRTLTEQIENARTELREPTRRLEGLKRAAAKIVGGLVRRLRLGEVVDPSSDCDLKGVSREKVPRWTRDAIERLLSCIRNRQAVLGASTEILRAIPDENAALDLASSEGWVGGTDDDIEIVPRPKPRSSLFNFTT